MMLNMKRILLMALLIGSLAVQAATDDSIRIVPKFDPGDCRTYQITAITHVSGQLSDVLESMNPTDTTSVEYQFTVESVTPDHYAMFLKVVNLNKNYNSLWYQEELGPLIDFFCSDGFNFYLNRHTLRVDSIDRSGLVQPLKEFFIKTFRERHLGDEQDLELYLNEGINLMATELLEKMIETWAEQYGRSYALGESHWIEADSADVSTPTTTEMELEAVEPYYHSIYEDSSGDDGEISVAEEISDDVFDVPDQIIHDSFAAIDDDGTIHYREKVTWESAFVEDWFMVKEATLDPKGWPVEICDFINFGETSLSVNWQLINKN